MMDLAFGRSLDDNAADVDALKCTEVRHPSIHAPSYMARRFFCFITNPCMPVERESPSVHGGNSKLFCHAIQKILELIFFLLNMPW
jgi:hypothetical protein